MTQKELDKIPAIKKVVRLWNAGGIYLIFLHNSGIIYTNQTGGISCCHPFEEGILLPFNNQFTNNDEENLYVQLSSLLENLFKMY